MPIDLSHSAPAAASLRPPSDGFPATRGAEVAAGGRVVTGSGSGGGTAVSTLKSGVAAGRGLAFTFAPQGVISECCTVS